MRQPTFHSNYTSLPKPLSGNCANHSHPLHRHHPRSSPSSPCIAAMSYRIANPWASHENATTAHTRPTPIDIVCMPYLLSRSFLHWTAPHVGAYMYPKPRCPLNAVWRPRYRWPLQLERNTLQVDETLFSCRVKSSTGTTHVYYSDHNPGIVEKLSAAQLTRPSSLAHHPNLNSQRGDSQVTPSGFGIIVR